MPDSAIPPGLDILASTPIPNVHQVLNACGIASVIMVARPNKNKIVDEFFRKLEKKITKELKISVDKYGFEERVQFALAWLLVHVLFKNQEATSIMRDGGIDIESVRALVSSKFDEMLVYQTAKGNARFDKEIEKATTLGKPGYSFLHAYLDEQKTDAELKVLAYLVGYTFSPVAERDGGNPLGEIDRMSPKNPEQYARNVDLLANHLNIGGAVLGHYEFHWLAIREVGKHLEIFQDSEKNTRSVGELQITPHFFKFNNPLSGTVVSVTHVDVLDKYTFYCFDIDYDLQKKCLNALSNELKL
nr:hypothetical protein [Candidatus Sigynarchaeota archaeon]